MKKIILISGLALILSSCSDKGGMSEQAKKNSESMNGIIKAIETKDFDKLDQYMAADVVDHAAMNGPSKGLDAVKNDLREQSKFSDDGKIEVVKELADDDYVMSWLRFSGTMAMDQMGMKKGEKYNMNAVEVAKFNKDGKVTEHWTFVDPAEMAKMMMAMSQPPGDTSSMPKRDTSNQR